MAYGPKNIRDTKVTKGSGTFSGGVGSWIGIIAGGVVLLLLLGWVFGFFADDDMDTTTLPADDNAVVIPD